MTSLQKFAALILTGIALATVLSVAMLRTNYATQFRNIPNAEPSRQHWLGADDLGRDRFARLAYGTAVSLSLAPIAAFISVILAACIGGVAGYLGGTWERIITAAVELVLCMPWLFLLIAVRAMLPLNISPLLSVIVTFSLLGSLGWAASARVVCASVSSLRNSEFILRARASGTPNWRLLLVHLLPNLKPVLGAQFLISVPVFILTEANLGILGLGVSEPLPSWGSLLTELESMHGFGSAPWKLVPLVLLVLVVISFQLIISSDEVSA